MIVLITVNVTEPDADRDGGQVMTAPLGLSRPAMDISCGRLTETGHCGKPSTRHVAWTPDMDNGVMCEDHWAEAQRRWTYYDAHPIAAFCTMPGTEWVLSWDYPPGDCALLIDGETATAVLEAQFCLST